MADLIALDSSSRSGPKASQPRAGAARSRATKRASLACVQCRSKHVKCDGGLPGCLRCQLEEKCCYYAPSRRGIRDPMKRNMMRDESSAADTEQSSGSTPSPNFMDTTTPTHHEKPLRDGWYVVKDRRVKSSTPKTYFLDLYYTYFHDTHSWLPPKKTLLRLLEEQPQEFDFMIHMIDYVGSVYTNLIDSAPLRKKAHGMAIGSLATTVWNIQALLCISISAFGESNIELCGFTFTTAVEMALELGLQHKSFADAEKDPILAESYRRTYWALYVHGSLRTVREHRGHFQLYSTPATTELPCEEWEYQSGDIPVPVSLQEYDRKGASRDYSSWAYLAALIRIAGESVVPLLNVGWKALPEAIERADHRIKSWLAQLPKWKQELVDSNGVVDMILFHALGIAHGLRIRIQLHLHGAGVDFRVQNLITDGSIFTPLSVLPPKACVAQLPWLYGPTAFHASLSLVGLFLFELPPEKFSPSCIFGIERAVLPMLDAYLYGGIRTPVLRDKIMLLANVLGKAGEFWPLSKAVSENVVASLAASEDKVGRGYDEQEIWEQVIAYLEKSGADKDSKSHIMHEDFEIHQPSTSECLQCDDGRRQFSGRSGWCD